jgi:Amt family ammonium transporter
MVCLIVLPVAAEKAVKETAPSKAAIAQASEAEEETTELDVETAESTLITEDEEMEASPVEAESTGEEEAVIEEAEAASFLSQDHANILWTCLAAFLVFFMQAGFAMVELGFTRAKNAINIIMKNLMDFALGSLVFWLIGFGLMFGVTSGGIIGTDGFGLFKYMYTEEGGLDYWTFTFWIFQTVFAATAATIVSGAMAERTKFVAYLAYTVFISALIYPVFGHWAWGNLFQGDGWLANLGFIDFAGSTVVHSLGGWAALAGAICLGPRLGKYNREGIPQAIPGHNLPLAALGVFILWFGWFGFNPGSTTVAGGDLAVIAVTTNMAAAAGAVMAMITAWIRFGVPDIGMSLNGALAGLVSITAGCANVSPLSAVMIGAIAGVLVVVAVLFFESVGIDDPVGAVSVHGVCGAWGTLAVGLFAQAPFGTVNGLFFGGGAGLLGIQALGVFACFVWTMVTSFVMFTAIRLILGLRVNEDEEMDGLDYGEHAGSAYPDFTVVVSR